MSDVEKFKIPPQNIEAEQAVLGAMLLDNESIHRAIELVQPLDFYRETHRHIYEAILSLYQRNEPADLVTLTSELKNKKLLESIGGATFIATLVDAVPTAANIVPYCRIIHEKAIVRRLIEGATKIVSQGYDHHGDTDEFLDRAEQMIFDVAERRAKQGFSPVKEIVKDSFKAIEQLYEKRELITGLPTGFKELDRLTAGFQRSDLIIIAGRPSMGKTAFALNIVESAAIDTHKICAVFSLEMSKEQLVQRMLCSRALVDASKLRGGFLAESDWPKLTRAAGLLSEASIFIDDTPALTVLEVRAKARRLQREHGIDMIIVDYLQLMRGVGRVESREREISEISRSLKALAKEVNVPVIALSQLNRGVESRQDKRPQLSDLRESGSIEQDADVVAFIYRDEMYNPDSPDAGKAEIIIGKQRNGPTGRVMLAFRSHLTRFDNFERGVDAPSSPAHYQKEDLSAESDQPPF
ncbi:MAG: replicative DNA helicase [Deltaproteobacteria bacterium RIFCSPLOWO2_02_FULL_44_10]|nr:MAG: replicative DNA helicase [Deltaproteobacteria bacterium RIFCSPHIGHO2_02_FULL_44_16]OGQ47096.1 MAG: replicative DNA helicase [Deltaproteobacteria bacterium RIFCSPLOWO2_02_FULL_44_10]